MRDDPSERIGERIGERIAGRIAEEVRRALIERATAAHEDARLQGLCWEGAWEAAISAMREFDLRAAATPPSVRQTRAHHRT